MFYKKGVLKNFAIFTGKHLYRSLFFIKVAGLRPATFLKKDWHRGFLVIFAKILRTPFLQNTFGWMLRFYNSCWLHTLQLYIVGNFQVVKNHLLGKNSSIYLKGFYRFLTDIFHFLSCLPCSFEGLSRYLYLFKEPAYVPLKKTQTGTSD